MRHTNLIAVSLLIISILTGCTDDLDNWQKTNFDQPAWAQSAEMDRYIFAADLIESKRLLGLSQHEVLRLLGKSSYAAKDGSYITYVIKAEGGSVFILDIRFDANKAKPVVKNVFVRAD